MSQKIKLSENDYINLTVTMIGNLRSQVWEAEEGLIRLGYAERDADGEFRLKEIKKRPNP